MIPAGLPPGTRAILASKRAGLRDCALEADEKIRCIAVSKHQYDPNPDGEGFEADHETASKGRGPESPGSCTKQCAETVSEHTTYTVSGFSVRPHTRLMILKKPSPLHGAGWEKKLRYPLRPASGKSRNIFSDQIVFQIDAVARLPGAPRWSAVRGGCGMTDTVKVVSPRRATVNESLPSTAMEPAETSRCAQAGSYAMRHRNLSASPAATGNDLARAVHDGPAPYARRARWVGFKAFAGLNNTATAWTWPCSSTPFGGEAVSRRQRSHAGHSAEANSTTAGLQRVAHKTGWITGIVHDAASCIQYLSTEGFADHETASRAGAGIAAVASKTVSILPRPLRSSKRH